MTLFADLTPLRESPAFRRLWAGTTLSSVGGAMTMFAVSLKLYDITSEAGAVGSLTTPVIGAPSGGLLTIVAAIAIGATIPGFRRYRAGEPAGQAVPA